MAPPKLAARGVERTPMLRGVTLEVARGESLALVGPSGAGKSSLLRTLNGLDPIDRGSVELDGRDVRDLPPTELRRRVGLVFQVPRSLAPTVEDEISFGPRLRKSNAEELRQRSRHELERVGLPAEFLSRAMPTLSIGEQQRVAIARALANDPEVLLLDEPTAALDPTATRGVLELLAKLRADGLTIVMVSHALEHTKTLGGRVALLVAGQLVEVAPVAEFFESPRDPRTRDFVAGRLA